MAQKDIHYYEPANGHGLKYDPFNAIVAPRPIGWISSRDAKGNINLAPYSFFNAFCYKPPIVGFSSTSWKDSVSNIQETEEFCWNLAIMDLAKQMNATSAHVAHDINEFTIAGLTATPSKIVRVPRVAESPVSFECRLSEIVQLKRADGGKAEAWLTLGGVVAVHGALDGVTKAAGHCGVTRHARQSNPLWHLLRRAEAWRLVGCVIGNRAGGPAAAAPDPSTMCRIKNVGPARR